MGCAMYAVEVSNKGTGIFDVTARENTMTIEPMGKGFAPAEVLLASLGSCIGFFVRRYAEQTKLEIKEFSIRLESEFSQGPMSLRRIKVQVDLKGVELDAQRRKALAAFVKNCPIKATLERSPKIELSIA